ncbi:MAG: hypothetical protein WB586_26475 [Chthoniobacterales bacterium]
MAVEKLRVHAVGAQIRAVDAEYSVSRLAYCTEHLLCQTVKENIQPIAGNANSSDGCRTNVASPLRLICPASRASRDEFALPLFSGKILAKVQRQFEGKIFRESGTSGIDPLHRFGANVV